MSNDCQPTEKMVILPDGNVGIGNTAPLYRLDISRTESIEQNPTCSESLRLGVNNGTGADPHTDVPSSTGRSFHS